MSNNIKVRQLPRPLAASLTPLQVVVRCRPLNAREVARGAKCLIRMEGGTHTFLDPPDEDDAATKNKKATERKTMSFAFDHSYWSAGPKDEPGYATQQMLFEDLGVSLLDSGFRGFNGTIFACPSPSRLAPRRTADGEAQTVRRAPARRSRPWAMDRRRASSRSPAPPCSSG